MTETKRQKQVSKLILEELNEIFLKEGLTMFDGGMVSIAKVNMTPDLLEARIYLSLFKVNDVQAYMTEIQEKVKEIRFMLGNKLRNQLRRVPELKFFQDDTLDYVFKMEDLFKKIGDERAEIEARRKKASGQDPEAGK